MSWESIGDVVDSIDDLERVIVQDVDNIERADTWATLTVEVGVLDESHAEESKSSDGKGIELTPDDIGGGDSTYLTMEDDP